MLKSKEITQTQTSSEVGTSRARRAAALEMLHVLPQATPIEIRNAYLHILTQADSQLEIIQPAIKTLKEEFTRWNELCNTQSNEQACEERKKVVNLLQKACSAEAKWLSIKQKAIEAYQEVRNPVGEKAGALRALVLKAITGLSNK